jgi:hypothetical protein
MKVKVSDKQLTEWVKEVLDGKDSLNEGDTSISKDDIKAIVKKEIKDFLNITKSGDLEVKVQKMVKDTIKSNKELEKYMVEISKNVLIQMYKNLWMRRNFWSSDLKNSAN